MLDIEAGNLWAEVRGTPDELAWLDSYLSVPEKGAENTDAFQEGRWDGVIRLFDRRRARFASGLVRLVMIRARAEGIQVRLQDVRERPGAPIDPEAGSWLRPYQKEALAAMLARGRGIVSMPTGSGKTEVFAALVQAIPIRWLVLVDTRDLMHQAAARILERTGEEAGVVGDGEWSPRRVTVATLQTLSKYLGDNGRVDQLLDEVEGIVGDEVQVLAAREFNKVAMATRNAWYRYGVSATPLEREDEADYLAISALGPLLHELSARVLIDAGVLARPEIVMVEYQHQRMTGSFAAIYEAGVTLCQGRNEMLAEIAMREDLAPRPCLTFFRAIAHGRRLRDLIQKGASVEMLSGVHQTSQRNAAKRRLTSGRIDVLLVSRIWNKGVDVPDLASGINGASGASVMDAVQKVGRLLRIPEGSDKRSVRYYDVLDLRNHYLEHHARKRMEAYRGRGYAVHAASAAAILRRP